MYMLHCPWCYLSQTLTSPLAFGVRYHEAQPDGIAAALGHKVHAYTFPRMAFSLFIQHACAIILLLSALSICTPLK